MSDNAKIYFTFDNEPMITKSEDDGETWSKIYPRSMAEQRRKIAQLNELGYEEIDNPNNIGQYQC